MMKRIALLLSVLMALAALAGCSAPPADVQEPAAVETAQPAQTAAPSEPLPSGPDEVTFSYADTVAWDSEYEVVIVGYGGAGAVASITASDLDAKVLMVEKAPKGDEGGNTRVCGQHVVDFTDYEEGVTYLKAVRDRYTVWPDEWIELFVKEVAEFEPWWNAFGYTEYETRPRADYAFAGADSVIMYYTELPGNPRLWTGLSEQVQKRVDEEKLEIWYDSPATKLIQDPYTKTVLGVQVETEGRTVNVRAKNGVILACGGFENNQEMIQNYLQRPYNGHLGTKYNTGDGIKMAIEVGADLWHMSATSGPYPSFEDPQSGIGRMVTSAVGANAAIFVGPDGTRFMDENFSPKHGYIRLHDVYTVLNIPPDSWMVFDQATLDHTELLAGFGEGNRAALEKGWIVGGSTIEALAEKTRLPAEALAAQIEQFNGFAKTGEDAQFGRAAENLTAFDGAGYYALRVTPCNLNTQGGPVRNTSCEVLDTDGNSIPNLYSAGELGSMHSGLYQGGSNVGECFVTGRIAARNACAAKEAPAPVTLTRAEQPEPFVKAAVESASASTAANEYIGTATGMGGEIELKVTVNHDEIDDIEILSHHETKGIGTLAFDQLIPQIIAANGTRAVVSGESMDAVSGATVTSNAIFQAVENALAQAN